MAYITSSNPFYREAQKALKEAAEKAGKKGPMVTGGIKKSGKKWAWSLENDTMVARLVTKFDKVDYFYLLKWPCCTSNKWAVTQCV